MTENEERARALIDKAFREGIDISEFFSRVPDIPALTRSECFSIARNYPVPYMILRRIFLGRDS